MFEGVLTKMKTELTKPVRYYLDFGTQFICMNQLLEKTIRISFVKNQCLYCGNDKVIYRQGYCKNCFFDIPQAADWVMKPELSKAHLGIEDRDLTYEKSIQLQPHIVYLANSGTIKVGVTRKTQVPTRWIDQGAHEAIEILEVPNRYLAGIAEIALKKYVSDKTNWRKMLKNETEILNLQKQKIALKKHLPQEVLPYFIEANTETQIYFPVVEFCSNPKSLNLREILQYQGVLKGIKGQYLIFEGDTVFNIRSNEGLVCNFKIQKT